MSTLLTPPPQADLAPSQPWLYRSEAFAEDLGELDAEFDRTLSEDDARSLPARLGWPLSVLVVCVGVVIGLGWA